MNIELELGKYIVAVSGGVDSMVLLDVVRKTRDVVPIVAHFDHGIRPDSQLDRELVMNIARKYNLEFVYEEGRLGANTSEKIARDARYDFLRRTQQRYDAKAIITAHHRDDLLETAILNLLRGTGWRGIVSLRSRDGILRPLLRIDKSELYAYAKVNGIEWREDSTNVDLRYRRNCIRHRIIPKMSPLQRFELLDVIDKLQLIGSQIEQSVSNILGMLAQANKLDRTGFICLPHNISRETMLAWLYQNDIGGLSSNTIERLVVVAKTYRVNKQADINNRYSLRVCTKFLVISSRNS